MERVYEVLDVLGRGGFGVVYRCRYRGPHGFFKEVAVKCLLPGPDEEASAEFLRRFRDEARMLGLLRHRAIVSVDRLVRVERAWAVVMEYVDGVDLSRIIEYCGPLPERIALEITADVAGALDYASRAPGPSGQPLALLHRDIKPANIQLTVDGQAKVLDFGIARAEWEHREAATQDLRFGSPPFMAPERFRGLDHPRGDVYSLGAVLYPLLAGVALGGARSTNHEHARFIGQRLTDLGEARPLRPELSALLERMLAGHPDARPEASEVERACRAIIADLPTRPDLRDFAAVEVPKLRRAVSRDPAVGTTLRERSETVLEVSGPVEAVRPMPVQPTGPKLPPPPKLALDETGAVPGDAARPEAAVARSLAETRGGIAGQPAPTHAETAPTAATVLHAPRPQVLAPAGGPPSLSAFPTGATALAAEAFPTPPERPRAQPSLGAPVASAPAPRPASHLLALLAVAVLGTSAVVAVLLGLALRPEPAAEPVPVVAAGLPATLVSAPASSESSREPEPAAVEPESRPVAPSRSRPPVAVQLTADGARVELRGATTVALPGRPPPGVYTLYADYGDGWERGAAFTLGEGQRLRVVCTRAFHVCEATVE